MQLPSLLRRRATRDVGERRLAVALISTVLATTMFASTAVGGGPAPNTSSALIEPGSPITYTRFDGGRETLTPWVGRNVALLAPVSGSYSPQTMTKIIGALDSAWDFYEAMTRHAPAPNRTYQGRDSIAVVSSTCGAACSYVGSTGSEILGTYFHILYDGVANNDEYDQVMFYEFGRSFFFYYSILAPATTYGSVVTVGFAILMRSRTMHAIGIAGGPYNGAPFSTLESRLAQIITDYDTDLTKTFSNTLAVDSSTSADLLGGGLFVSILELLASHYGGDCFLQSFFDAATAGPGATTDGAAVTNFVNAAGKAAGVDLRPLFYQYWSFPRPDGATAPRVPGGIAALPAQVGRPVCPPTTALSPTPPWVASASIPLVWSAMSVIGPVTSYDVRYRRAKWNSEFGPSITWQSGTSAVSATFTGTPGSTYCFGVRARDASGSVSAWPAETCAAIPLDDRSLTRSGRWVAGTGTAYYMGTYLRSSTVGSKLVRSGVVARRIALVVTTCATCGSVDVYWGSTRLKTINLYSAATVNRALVVVATFPSVRTGTLTISVRSHSGNVTIDGVAIGRS